MLLATMALTLLVASGVVLGAVIGSAGAQSSVVGPGESIQKAVNAADPGDTIVVRGVHREDVVIRKDGIKLRGDDAVIQAPTRAKADSPCSKEFGPEAICVLGDVNLKTEKLKGQRVSGVSKTEKLKGQRVSGVSVSGFTIRGFKIAGKGGNEAYVIDVEGARNATVVGNRLIGNVAGGIGAFSSVNTTIAKNHVIGSPEIDPETNPRAIIAFRSVNTTVAKNHVIGSPETDPETDAPGIQVWISSRTTVVGNNISGGAWGILVYRGAHRGFFAGNTIHNNCTGMFFEAFPSKPVGDFVVIGNTVENNTRSCRAAQWGENFSGIGIALLGASGTEVTGNQISGNVPSGPTPVSGGVVVATDPFDEGTTTPMNNSVTGNLFGHNKPDIYWDKSGSGNRFLGNLCNTSVPSSLCN
jgi:parallel beta-helix repeat protein